jgi:hypothetical protein
MKRYSYFRMNVSELFYFAYSSHRSSVGTHPATLWCCVIMKTLARQLRYFNAERWNNVNQLKESFMFRVALFLFLFLVSSSEVFADCLSDVSNFAEKICGQIKTSGNTQLIEANGELKAEVSGIVRKALGDVKGDVNGKILQDTYENVLREDLSKELFNVRECRQKMAEKALEVCSSSTH